MVLVFLFLPFASDFTLPAYKHLYIIHIVRQCLYDILSLIATASTFIFKSLEHRKYRNEINPTATNFVKRFYRSRIPLEPFICSLFNYVRICAVTSLITSTLN